MHGEAASVDEDTVTIGRNKLHEVLAGYSDDEIYNMDETGFFYKLGPSQTLGTTPGAGTKKSKDRITVAFMVNASGTDKRKPIVIAKAARPRSFKKVFDPNIYCDYFYNKKAWMTSAIFNDILRRFDRTLQKQNRRALLLVDNAGCHVMDREPFTNLRVEFLPANTTAKLQPLDAGIIRAVKAAYRTDLVRHYLACAEGGNAQTVDLRWSLLAIVRSWNKITSNVVTNCWRHTRILPLAAPPEVEDPLDIVPLSELKAMLARGNFPCSDSAAQAYVDIDSSEDVAEGLSDDDILELVAPPPADDAGDATVDTSSEEELCAPALVNVRDATQALKMALQFFEQQKDIQNVHAICNAIETVESLQIESATKQTVLTDFFRK